MRRHQGAGGITGQRARWVAGARDERAELAEAAIVVSADGEVRVSAGRVVPPDRKKAGRRGWEGRRLVGAAVPALVDRCGMVPNHTP